MTIRFVKKDIFEKIIKINKDYDSPNIKLSYDSRTDVENSVFFAFEGENFDGHDFIENIINKCFLVIAKKSKFSKFSDHRKIIFVDCPLLTYSLIAKKHLEQFNIQKIAITGSSGKTSTKEILYSALIKLFLPESVYKNPGNLNNHIGVPISALEINESHKIAIFEMGMNHALEITNLCQIVNPTVGIITNIGTAHQGNFIDGQDGVQKAKGELFAYLENNKGTAIINIDDERIVNEANKRKFTHKITYSLFNKKADIFATDLKDYSLEKKSQQVTIDDHKQTYICKIPLAGLHSVYNTLSALACIKHLNLSLTKAIDGIESTLATNGRMNIINHKDFLIIDDAYNANPDSFKAGLLALKNFDYKRKIGILGSMAELGEHSLHYHQELGSLLPKYFTHLFLCGPMATEVADAAIKNGFNKDNIVIKKSSNDLIVPLKYFIKKEDLLFIKGSNSNNMEIIVKEICQVTI